MNGLAKYMMMLKVLCNKHTNNAIPYPALPEQNTITKALNDMDSEVTALEVKLSTARQVKAGSMRCKMLVQMTFDRLWNGILNFGDLSWQQAKHLTKITDQATGHYHRVRKPR
jgi:hypothetical protein